MSGELEVRQRDDRRQLLCTLYTRHTRGYLIQTYVMLQHNSTECRGTVAVAMVYILQKVQDSRTFDTWLDICCIPVLDLYCKYMYRCMDTANTSCTTSPFWFLEALQEQRLTYAYEGGDCSRYSCCEDEDNKTR